MLWNLRCSRHINRHKKSSPLPLNCYKSIQKKIEAKFCPDILQALIKQTIYFFWQNRQDSLFLKKREINKKWKMLKLTFNISKTVLWITLNPGERLNTYLKLVSAIFYQIFIFSPNDSPSKTMKKFFYFI